MMDLIIKIPDEVYKTVQDGSYCGSLYEELKAAIPLPYESSEDLIRRSDALKAVDNRHEELLQDTEYRRKHCSIDLLGIKKHILAIPPANVFKLTKGDLISREALKEAISTSDKFACLPDTRLVPFYELPYAEKDYVPYVHLADIVKAIDNAPPVPQVTVFAENADEKAVADMKAELQNVVEARPNEQIAWEQGYEAGLAQGKQDRPKGEWIKNKGRDLRDNFYTCSICGRTINVICGETLANYPYCHCGADMRKGDAEE